MHKGVQLRTFCELLYEALSIVILYFVVVSKHIYSGRGAKAFRNPHVRSYGGGLMKKFDFEKWK